MSEMVFGITVVAVSLVAIVAIVGMTIYYLDKAKTIPEKKTTIGEKRDEAE